MDVAHGFVLPQERELFGKSGTLCEVLRDFFCGEAWLICDFFSTTDGVVIVTGLWAKVFARKRNSKTSLATWRRSGYATSRSGRGDRRARDAWSSSCDARAGDDGGLGKVQALANDGAIMRAVVGLLTTCDVSYLCVNV